MPSLRPDPFDRAVDPSERRALRGWRLAATAAALCGLLGCRGLDVAYDCDLQHEDFDDLHAASGHLLPAIPDYAPYPAALRISEAGINELLRSTVGKDVPFTGQLSFGPGVLAFAPESPPVLQLTSLEGCRHCIVLALDFGVEFRTANAPASAGIGSVMLRVPLELVVDGIYGATLVAAYDRMTIEYLKLSVFGFDSEEHEALAGALRVLMTERIQRDYGPTNLLEIGAFPIGKSNVRLSPRELFLFPDTKVLAIGLHSNLVLPEGSSLALDRVIPEDAPLQFDLTSALFPSVLRRLLRTGTIPRQYDEDGGSNPDGAYGASLEGMVPSTTLPQSFEASFRIWRLEGGYCGNALATMPIGLSLKDGKIAVSAGDVTLIEGEGVGSVAVEERELVDEHGAVFDAFKASLTDGVRKTLGYDGLDIDGREVLIENKALDVTPERVTTQMDFVVVETDG